MKLQTILTTTVVAATAIGIAGIPASAFTLNSGSGDGTVTVGVDGFGSFGSSVSGTGTSDAFYDAVGGSTSGTTFQSGLAIRVGENGGRTFLTSGTIGNRGGTVTQAISGSSTSATSAFTFNGLAFSLTQTLVPLFNAGVRTGSALTQTYNIVNTSTSRLAFELVRYLDGDLYFDGSYSADGGGRIATGTETLFETDSATGSSVSTTFVGINTTGGTTPTAGRYEIASYSGLLNRIIAGTALANTVQGDGADADQFVDAGNGYDVTLALRNSYSLLGGQSAVYTTQTIFGSGAPSTPRETVPEPTTIFGALVGGALINGVRRFRKRQ